MSNDDEERYAPSVFMSDYDLPNPATVVNQSLPRGVEGGVIETIKRAVITAVRDALTASGLTFDGNPVHVDLEYPSKPAEYPGIWVQFSPTSLMRAGIDQEHWVKRNGEWCPIQEWEIRGRVNLTIVALKNKDRDRVADAVIAMLAFSRPPNVVITDPTKDAQQHRSLKTALANNPYVAMTFNSDVIYPGGQSAEFGVPWQTPPNSDTLAYTDSYAFDLIGNFNVMFRHDGVYELVRIDVGYEQVDEVPQYQPWSPWYGVNTHRTL